MSAKNTGPSAIELKMRAEVDRLRRELSRLKKAASADGGDPAHAARAAEHVTEHASPVASVNGADGDEVTRLRGEIEQLTNARERLGKLYFHQIEENRQRTARLHRLLKALREISSHLELGTLMQRLAESIKEVLGYRIVLVRLREPGSEDLRVAGVVGVRPSGRARLEAEIVPLADFRSWLRDEFKVSRSYFISHKSSFSQVLPPGVVTELGPREEWEWHADDVLLVPLVTSQDEIVGYLSVDDPADRMVPSQESIEMLEVFAGHAVVAVENARLVQELQVRGRELEDANDRMKEMNSLKNNFVATVSHELRTPLTAIRAYVETMLAAEAGNISADQQRGFLGIVLENSDRLSRLIESVLDLSRFDSGRLEVRRMPVELSEVVEEAVWLLRPMAQAGRVDLKVRNELTDTRVEADRDQMRQLVLHLGSNAVKFTPSGGAVTLHVSGDERTLTLRVEDTGIGIPGNELEKIFDRFYQVDSSSVRRFGGTGLGLSISKAIVDAHGGRIAAESEPGRGSVFAVQLKRHAGRRVLLRPLSGPATASDDILRLAVEMVSEAMDAGLVSLMGCEPDGDLVIRAAIGLDPAVVSETRVAPGTGVAGWVAQNRRPVCVRPEDPPTPVHDEVRRQRYTTGSFISVPLEGAHGLMGVLNVTDPSASRAFDAEDCALLLDLAERIARAWENASVVESSRARVDETSDALRMVLQHLKDGRRTAPHRVRLAQALARELGLGDAVVRSVGFAATVHDVGMTLVGEDVLARQTPLTEDQRAEIQRHVELGIELLKPLETMGEVREIVLSHHEWWDGSGYPRGLRGEEIPLGARILAVVDAFEAMTLGRAHRSPLSEMAALNELVRLAGSQFDPAVVEAFERMLPAIHASSNATAGEDDARGATNAGR
ncbi:MAG TPA: HD domain-containing phosphohydrolase [Dongiaceae bacterium]|nr:HD domain-containing phosphohydrolase [Dongiaceae bacterium]